MQCDLGSMEFKLLQYINHPQPISPFSCANEESPVIVYHTMENFIKNSTSHNYWICENVL